MSCNCLGLDEVFGARRARRDARRLRRRGIARRARRLVDALAAAYPLNGARSLEVGAGVGGLTLELLEKRGVSRATTFDASQPAVDESRRLAAERGVAERMRNVAGDFAAAPLEERFDVVVLDRVVCCYPAWRELLLAAADATAGAMALSYPREAWYTRAFVGTANGIQKLLRRRFRIWVHPVAAMHACLREAGLEPAVSGHDGPWELTVAVRGGIAARPAG